MTMSVGSFLRMFERPLRIGPDMAGDCVKVRGDGSRWSLEVWQIDIQREKERKEEREIEKRKRNRKGSQYRNMV